MKKHIYSFFLIFSLFLSFSCTNGELTSDISTTKQETTQSQLNQCSYDIDLSITNGSESIETHFVMCVASGTGGENFTADGFCLPYNFVDNTDSFASIDDTNALSIVQSDLYIDDIEVFNMQGTLLDTWSSLTDHPTLDSGQYIIRIHSRSLEDSCIIEGHHYFILNR